MNGLTYDKGLFPGDTTLLPPRPKKDEATVLEAAKRLAAELNRTRKHDFPVEPEEDEDEDDGFVKDIADAIMYNCDGYEICRELERKSWSVDADLVEFFEGLAMYTIDEVVGGHTHRWIETYGIAPALTLGASVVLPKHYYGRDGKGPIVEARITAINTKEAKYTVTIPSMDHVMPGELGTHGYLVPYEEVESAPVSAEKEQS
jgi:hypothetical protein